VSLRRYAQIAAGVFIVLSLTGFIFAAFNLSGFFGPDLPANVMHLFVGLLYGYVGFWAGEAAPIRTLIGGMGALLLLGKGLIIAADLLSGQDAFSSVTEVVCLVIGSTSILAAKYLPGGASGP
jgi:hypothetical protein